MHSPDPAEITDHRLHAALRSKSHALIHYRGGESVCSCCGEPRLELFAVDHADGSGSKHRETATLLSPPSDASQCDTRG